MEKVVVYGDQLQLHWGRQSKLPKGVLNFAFGHKASMNALRNYFKNCGKFMRWSEYQGYYVMNFSKQNLKRIRADFGPVPLVDPEGRVKRLKALNNKFVDMVNLARKAKEAPFELLPKYDYKCEPLGEYQHRGVVLMNNVEQVPLFAQCGMGKTFQVLVSTQEQIKRGVIKKGKTLISAKLNTLETGWLEDAEKFTDLKIGMLWNGSSYKRREKILKVLHDPQYDAFVINHEGVTGFEKELTEMNFQKVVIDESTILKGFKGMSKKIKGGAFGRAIMNIAHSAEWRVVMSGSPAPNGPQDLWGQFYFLNPEGFLIEPSYNDYGMADMTKMYFGKTNKRDKNTGKLARPDLLEGEPLNKNTPSKIYATKTQMQNVFDRISPLMYRLRLRDHIDVPPLMIEDRRVDMTKEQQKHYEDMKERFRVQIGDTEVRATVKLTTYGKLRQITSGFIIDHDEKVQEMKKSPKMDMLDQLVEEEIGPDEKILIFAEYQHEIKTIVERYKKYGALAVFGGHEGNSSKKNMENIKKFKGDEDAKILVLHPQSAAHGINLTESAYVIFYSISYSAEFNYQAIGRILRATQKRAMRVFYVLAKNSIDEIIFNVIIGKNRNQAKLIDADQFIDEMDAGFNQDALEENIMSDFKEAV